MWPFTSSNGPIIEAKRAERTRAIESAGVDAESIVKHHARYYGATGVCLRDAGISLTVNPFSSVQLRKLSLKSNLGNGQLRKCSKPSLLVQSLPIPRRTV